MNLLIFCIFYSPVGFEASLPNVVGCKSSESEYLTLYIKKISNAISLLSTMLSIICHHKSK